MLNTVIQKHIYIYIYTQCIYRYYIYTSYLSLLQKTVSTSHALPSRHLHHCPNLPLGTSQFAELNGSA